MFSELVFITKENDKPKLNFVEGNACFLQYLNKYVDKDIELLLEVKEANRSHKQNKMYWSLLAAIDWQTDLVPNTITHKKIRVEILHTSFKRSYAKNILQQTPIIVNGEEFYEFSSTAFAVCEAEEFTRYFDFVCDWVEQELKVNYNELLNEYNINGENI